MQTYLARAATQSDVENRRSATRPAYSSAHIATNPATDTLMPVWIADYVLTGFGTGAIMAVPAHDSRDHAFARAFGLPIVEVVAASAETDIEEEAWEGEGRLVNSGLWTGLDAPTAKRAAICLG